MCITEHLERLRGNLFLRVHLKRLGLFPSFILHLVKCEMTSLPTWNHADWISYNPLSCDDVQYLISDFRRLVTIRPTMKLISSSVRMTPTLKHRPTSEPATDVPTTPTSKPMSKMPLTPTAPEQQTSEGTDKLVMIMIGLLCVVFLIIVIGLWCALYRTKNKPHQGT